MTSDIWRLSDALSWWRLAAVCVGAISVTIVAVIVAHELWEQAPDPRVRAQVVLFNLATTLTVVVGIGSLCVALFAIVFAGTELVIAPRVLEDALHHPVGTSDFAAVAWFIASFGTIAGALAAGLESDAAIREAAYAGARSEEREAVADSNGVD